MSTSGRYGPQTKVIRIDPNAYEIIIRRRRKGETMSDVIRRLAVTQVTLDKKP